jgi:hypothetical protein
MWEASSMRWPGLEAKRTPLLLLLTEVVQGYQRGETGQRPGYTDNPFRPR